jgi:hypothetical protein
MHFLKLVSVNDAFNDELWNRVSDSRRYYSIGDGFSKEVFRKVFFQSNYVLKGPNIVVRLEEARDYVECHPIVFGVEPFLHAREAMGDCASLFTSKPVCCIIPSGLRGAKRLARLAGMHQSGGCRRPLSGVVIPCEIWRYDNVKSVTTDN